MSSRQYQNLNKLILDIDIYDTFVHKLELYENSLFFVNGQCGDFIVFAGVGISMPLVSLKWTSMMSLISFSWCHW